MLATRPLALASATRFAGYPDVPTFAELGYPAVDMPGWAGAFVPAKTPDAVVAKLTAELTRITMLAGATADIKCSFESISSRPNHVLNQ